MSRRNDAPSSRLHRLLRSLFTLACLSILAKIKLPGWARGSEHQEVRDRGPEPPDIDAGIVAGIGLGFLAFAVLSGLGLFFYTTAFIRGPLIKPEQSFPEPQLAFVHQAAELKKQQLESISALRNSEPGPEPARIAIDDAMRGIVARGDDALSAVEKPETPPGYARTGAGRLTRSDK